MATPSFDDTTLEAIEADDVGAFASSWPASMQLPATALYTIVRAKAFTILEHVLQRRDCPDVNAKHGESITPLYQCAVGIPQEVCRA